MKHSFLASGIILMIVAKYITCEIPIVVRNYVDAQKRLQKYSVTTLVDYEKNHSTYMEEKLILNLKDFVALSDAESLKNKILNVTVFQKENHEFDCRISKNEKNDTVVDGHSIDVLRSLQDILHFKVRYNIVDIYKNTENISMEEYLLQGNTSDLILCHPEVNVTLTEVLYPTLTSRYVLIYIPSNLAFTEDIFILTFAGTLWLCFIIVLILLAISLRISTKQYNRIYGYPKWGSVEITFWAIATACQQGLSSNPCGFSTRLIIFLGAITAYLLYTGFAAGITSLVAVQNQDFDISIADIQTMKLNVVSYGNMISLPVSHDYLKNSWNSPDLQTFFSQLNEKRWIGVTLQVFLNEYFSKNVTANPCFYFRSVIKESRYTVSNLVPKKSHLKKIFNYWLLRSFSSARNRNTPTNTTISDCVPDLTSNSGYSSARLEHVRSAIVVLLGGLVFSIFFAIGECIWNGYLHRKSRRPTQSLSSSRN